MNGVVARIFSGYLLYAIALLGFASALADGVGFLGLDKAAFFPFLCFSALASFLAGVVVLRFPSVSPIGVLLVSALLWSCIYLLIAYILRQISLPNAAPLGWGDALRVGLGEGRHLKPFLLPLMASGALWALRSRWPVLRLDG